MATLDYNNYSPIGSSGISSTTPMNSMGSSKNIQQNQNPVIFSKGAEVDKALSMSAAHSNIARLVTKNENGATGIANIINKEEGRFAEDITLSSALEKLKSAQDYNEDMKAVVLKSIEKASTNEDKIAVLEKGLAFLETEKKLSECVQSGKMGLDGAKALLKESLDFGCSKDFSLEKLNEFNEFSTNEQDGSTIQQKALKVFGTKVSTVSSPVNNDQSQTQSTNQPQKEQKIETKETNKSSFNGKLFNQAEHGEMLEKVFATPQQQALQLDKNKESITEDSSNLKIEEETIKISNEIINSIGQQLSKTLSNSLFQESKIEIKREENVTYTIDQEDYLSYDIDDLDEEEEEIKGGDPKQSEDEVVSNSNEENLTEETSKQDQLNLKDQPQVSEQKIDTSNHESNEISEPIAISSAEDKSKGINDEIKEKILTIATSYKAKRSSSSRRQMILDSLPESMDSATLDSILKDERCSRGVKTALLLSPNLAYEQKLKVVNSDKNNEIVAYCQKHKNVFPQVRSALTPTSNVIQGSMNFISKDSPTNLNKFVNVFFDQNGHFTIPDDIQAARDFFNPTTFTIEERTTIVKFLKTKKKQIGNASTSLNTLDDLNNVTKEKQINRLKIDMMIAQFTEPWDEGLTQKFKIFDNLTKEVISTLESNIEEVMNIDDSTGTITMKNFLKNPEKIAQKLSYIKDINLVFNQFQSLNESFPNSAIRKCNLMIVQQYPRLELCIKDACNPDHSTGHIDHVLEEMKNILIDFEHGQKVVFIAKKCSEFIEQHKNDKEYKGKDSEEIENDFLLKNGFSYSTGIADLTKTNAEAVNRLAQTLGYPKNPINKS